jgi:hypothetical protein
MMYRAYNPKYKQQQARKENKYHARKVVAQGQVFDSEKEYARYLELKLLEKAGEISQLERQVKYDLIPKQMDEEGKMIERPTVYVADFQYRDNNTGEFIVEDVKGYRRGQAYAVFSLKRKLLLWRYGIRIREV